MVYLKKAIAQTGITKKKLKELVIRAIYVEMLGQDASFAYIKAVELCASTSISQKKVGYLSGMPFALPLGVSIFFTSLKRLSSIKSFTLLGSDTRVPFHAHQPDSA